MLQKIFRLQPLVLMLLFFYGCQKETSHSTLSGKNGNTSATMKAGDQMSLLIIDGECPPVVKQLKDASSYVDPLTGPNPEDFYGTIMITDMGNAIEVKIEAKTGYFIERINVSYGSLTEVQNATANWEACSGTGLFNSNYIYSDKKTTEIFTIPASALGSDGCIWFAANVRVFSINSIVRCAYGYPADAPDADSEWKGAFTFCRCAPPPPADCGQLRTQTPGGWGAVPKGNNPGVYLHSNFAAVFPDGLYIGCYPGNYYVKLTSAQAITDYLPAGGDPTVLSANYTNPSTTALKNTLVSHLTALTLSVGFDSYDPSFGTAGTGLGSMIITSGGFANQAVSAFLEEANKVLGGCSTSYTIEQVLETASKINENYTDGKIDNGYLSCPE